MTVQFCQKFVEKKNRLCNRSVNSEYMGAMPLCLDHQSEVPFERRYCDGCRSWINAKGFAAHCQKKCPVVTRQIRIRTQEFFQEGRNASEENVDVSSISSPVSTLEERLLKLVPHCKALISEPCAMDLTPTLKHGRQHQAIISWLKPMGCLQSDAAIVEFGAGKADLTEAIVEEFSLSCDAVTVAVDMSSFRHPADCRLRRSVKFLRALINIRDFNMSAVSLLKGRDNIVCVSKHLCGVGFDYALRCIVKEAGRIGTVAMAPCCHHKCQWDQLVCREVLYEFGFVKNDFEEICRLSSWATQIDGDRSQYLIGYVCKWLINSCRARYLAENGFRNASCDRYVDAGITPENMLISGSWPCSSINV